ncbi:hypothetical protein [Jeotgalibacillus proteolyticus]|uniref:IDEAL domain-containing protein n=1 Tax=Jeotgalibacillus proteolyticus TaxID=2082395 RepID=A0A2S5GAP2_9BACL|nr:hypothetical protein [Jeotgalibacillus proteolyticus]PPA70066.1 hypothetical protein C4B60_10765 [Jeotgalibacillus proteolyticus]
MNFHVGMSVQNNENRHFGIVMGTVTQGKNIKGYVVHFYDSRKKEYYHSYTKPHDLVPVKEDHYIHRKPISSKEQEEEFQAICKVIAFRMDDTAWLNKIKGVEG